MTSGRGLRVAYPGDRKDLSFPELLVDSGLAGRRGSSLLSADGSLIDRLVTVNSADLPGLLLDGVFDAVFTTGDRLQECEHLEGQRARPRVFGRVVPLSGPEHPGSPSLVWGFSTAKGSGPRSWEEELLELARGGLEFSPGRELPRTVLCATTHPSTARAILDRLEVVSDVRYYPDPWSVVSQSPSYCGLAVAAPADLAARSLRLHADSPISDESPLLAFNEVAWASYAKQALLSRLESAILRLVMGRSTIKIDLYGPIVPIEQALAHNPAVRYLRAHAVSDPATDSRIEVVVAQSKVQSVMELLEGVGGRQMLTTRLHLADLRNSVVSEL